MHCPAPQSSRKTVMTLRPGWPAPGSPCADHRPLAAVGWGEGKRGGLLDSPQPCHPPCYIYMPPTACPSFQPHLMRSPQLLEGASEVEENLGWARVHKEAPGLCGLRARGSAAQPAHLREGRPPCCSMRKRHEVFSFSSKARRGWAVGLSTKLIFCPRIQGTSCLPRWI